MSILTRITVQRGFSGKSPLAAVQHRIALFMTRISVQRQSEDGK